MFFHKHGQISQQHKVDDQRQVSNLLLLPLYFSSFLATSRSNSIRVHCSSWTVDLFSSFVAVFGAVVGWRAGDQVLRLVLLEGTVMGKGRWTMFFYFWRWFGVMATDLADLVWAMEVDFLVSVWQVDWLLCDGVLGTEDVAAWFGYVEMTLSWFWDRFKITLLYCFWDRFETRCLGYCC